MIDFALFISIPLYCLGENTLELALKIHKSTKSDTNKKGIDRTFKLLIHMVLLILP